MSRSREECDGSSHEQQSTEEAEEGELLLRPLTPTPSPLSLVLSLSTVAAAAVEVDEGEGEGGSFSSLERGIKLPKL